nr:hypothetical protein CFP56_60214 [Quercus suber]
MKIGNAAAKVLRMKTEAPTAEAEMVMNVSMICRGGISWLVGVVAGGGREEVMIAYVVEGALEDGEEAGADQDDADARRDPVDVRRRGPGEDEDAGRQHDGPQHHRIQAGFGHRFAVVGVNGTDVEALVQSVRRQADDQTEEQREEWESPNDLAPMAVFLEDDGEGGKGAVDQPIDEAGVKGHQEADGRGKQPEGADEEYWSVRLIQQEGAEPADEALEDAHDEHGPPPSEMGRHDCAANDRRQHRPADHRQRIQDNGITSLFSAEDVGQDATSVGDGSASKEALEEPCDQDGLDILGASTAKNEHGTDEVRNQDDPFPAVDFA